MIIIGITGTLGSGKGTVVEYLKSKYGFLHYSASSFINQEIAKRNLPVNRDNQRMVANDLRATHGASFVAENLYEQAMQTGENAVLESLRAVGEIESLRRKPGHFFLLAVDADPKVRYDRIILRKSEKDKVSYEHFLEQEQKEMADTSSGGMQIAKCMEMADAHILNNGSIEELQKQIDEFIKPLLNKNSA